MEQSEEKLSNNVALPWYQGRYLMAPKISRILDLGGQAGEMDSEVMRDVSMASWQQALVRVGWSEAERNPAQTHQPGPCLVCTVGPTSTERRSSARANSSAPNYSGTVRRLSEVGGWIGWQD